MSDEPRWLLLIHQIPPKPGYLRVKVWRQLQRLGAVAIKNSVYVLPRSEQACEDFQWVLRAIVEGGGDGSICEARFAEGLSDGQVESLFHAARDADYGQIAAEASRLTGELAGEFDEEARGRMEQEAARLRRRFVEVTSIDFLGAPGREAADRLLSGLESRVRDAGRVGATPRGKRRQDSVRGRTWVTRKDIHVDRMASAWLVRRFIDPAAKFKFVSAAGYKPKPLELRFDMFEAEFSHEGDRCTFEVLLERFALEDAALRAVADIIHDIDLKDGKYGRPEMQGMAALVAGIALAHPRDEDRLGRASAVLDDLYAYFRSQAGCASNARPRKGRT